FDCLEPTKALDQGGAGDRSDRPSGDHGTALAPRGEPVTEGPACALAGLRTDILAHALQLAPDLLLHVREGRADKNLRRTNDRHVPSPPLRCCRVVYKSSGENPNRSSTPCAHARSRRAVALSTSVTGTG